MAILLIYKKSDGRVLYHQQNWVGNEAAADQFLNDSMDAAQIAAYGAKILTDLDMQGLSSAVDEDGRIQTHVLKVVNGVVTVDDSNTPGALTRIQARKARRGAKKQAKSDAKLSAFDGMSKNDFMALTANERWETIYWFMKAHFED